MTITNTNPAQIKAALQITAAVAEAIRELGSVPSGHLYAQLCGKLSLQQYESIIHLLKNTGLVSESFHELTWIGTANKEAN
jgi:hypothetical protein